MGDLLYSDFKEPNFDHPDSAIRLASVVHRFKVPKITSRVTFAKSFHTVGTADQTRKLMIQADESRDRLYESCHAGKMSAERIIADSGRYLPKIHTILLSCKVQPENARLDKRLIFEWKSGLESKPVPYKSEAMMYDLVMTIASTGIGYAVSATENSVSGDFAAASRDYAQAAGIFNFLAEEQLPQWISKGTKVLDSELPSECHAPMAAALTTLFMANGQQMAIATLLMKEGKPNYSLVAKLCLGVSEHLEDFVTSVRTKCTNQKARMDDDFFTLLALQIGIQKSLSLYFQARAAWDKMGYGLGIALLSEACGALRQRDTPVSQGIPDVYKIPALQAVGDDLKDLRTHMNSLLRSWENDNSRVYFVPVPQHVPASDKLQEGVQMKKRTEYTLEEVEPVLLLLPDTSGDNAKKSSSSPPAARPPLEKSDSDLARQLHEQLNT